jgi:ketosteroid isomerase-like protein
MSTTNALEVAQTYIRAVESKDRDAVAATLADTVRHIFPISYEPVGHPQAVFEGKDEVLAYIDSLFRKFTSMRWPAPDWSASADGRRAFLEGKGDGVVAHSQAPYRNTYLMRFDVEHGRIVQVTEYANAAYYVSLQIPPAEVEVRAVERAAAL